MLSTMLGNEKRETVVISKRLHSPGRVNRQWQCYVVRQINSRCFGIVHAGEIILEGKKSSASCSDFFLQWRPSQDKRSCLCLCAASAHPRHYPLLYASSKLPLPYATALFRTGCSLGPSAFPSCKLPSESALSMLQQNGRNSALVLSCGSVEGIIFLLTTFSTIWASTFQRPCGSSVYSERSCPSSLAWSSKLCSGRLRNGVDLPLTSKVLLWCPVFPPASWHIDIFAYLWISRWLSLIPVKTVLMLSSSKELLWF